jgi:hypothetical protein
MTMTLRKRKLQRNMPSLQEKASRQQNLKRPSQLPAELPNTRARKCAFGSVVFAKWGKASYLPALIVNPLALSHKWPAVKEWKKKVRNRKYGALTLLVYDNNG